MMNLFNTLTQGFVLGAANADKVTNKINDATLTLQIVFSAVVVGVAICVALFFGITKMPSLGDPHERHQFFKIQGWIMGAVAFMGVIIWLVPWVYSLFR
ncbi:conjugal transfer protein [Bacillus glycinifermentans]|nr:conjugal transfer protein [Bacillus glycinifermentans]